MTADDLPTPAPRSAPADATSSADRYRIVPMSARGGDQWSLTGRYVEMVWSELLGPTATLLARRLGDFLELHPGGGEFSLAAMGDSLGVAPSKVRRALVRLGRHGITTMCDARPIVGVSGLAPSIGPDLLARLSEVAGHEHRWQLEAAAGLSSPPVPGGRARAGRPAVGCPSKGGSGRSL